MIRKNLKKAVSMAITASMLLSFQMPVGVSAETVSSSNGIEKNILFSDDFESASSVNNYKYYRGNEASGSTVYFDDGTSAGGSTAIRHSVISDPTGGEHGGVLKLEGQEVGFDRYTHASREMTIPLSDEYSTVIEYDAASNVDMEAGEGTTAFGQAMLSYLNGNITANIMNALVKYGTGRSDFYCISPGYAIPTGALAKANEWHKVKVDLRLKEAGKDTVIVDVNYCGRTMNYECVISGVATNGLTGFSICYDSWNNDGSFSAYYVDNIEVYTQKEVEPTNFATEEGVIASDGKYYADTNTNSNLYYAIPENIGEGWYDSWEGAEGYRTYDFGGLGAENYLYLSGNGIVKRYFSKAISLVKPGSYELSQRTIENTGSMYADMRTYFGSEDFYAGVVGNKSTDGVVYPQLKVGDTYLVGNASTGNLHNFVKIKVDVKDSQGNADVFAKVWGSNQAEPDDWSLSVTNVNLANALGKNYLNWAGCYSKLDLDNYLGTGYFAETEVKKLDSEEEPPTEEPPVEEPTVESKTVLFEDGFEDETSVDNYSYYRGYEPSGEYVYLDNGTNAQGTTAIRHSIVNDPTGNGHGGVLKLEGQEVNYDRFTHASREMPIPLSDKYSTVIEYDAASDVDMEAGEGTTAFGQAMLSYLNGGITANINQALVKYGTGRSDFYCISPGYSIPTGALAKANEWHKVKVELRLKEAGKDTVIVDVNYCGRTMNYECVINGVATNGLTGFSICYDSWNNDGAFSAYYIDNVEVYTEQEVRPMTFAQEDGIIAKDGVYHADMNTNDSVYYAIPENAGKGFVDTWEGSEGYRTYNFAGLGNKNFIYMSGNGIVKRHFVNAIDLTLPGTYELEEKLIENTGSMHADMRVYFGSEKLYAGVVGDKGNDGIVYPQLKVGDTYLTAKNSTGNLHNFIKMSVTVKSEDGLGDVFVKAWSSDVAEPEEWSIELKNINLINVLGTDYLSWVGNYSKLSVDNYLGQGFFADTKIRKGESKVAKQTCVITNNEGKPISDASEITDSILVNASFTNTKSQDVNVLPIIGIYDGDGRLKDALMGDVFALPGDTEEAVEIDEFGYDGEIKELPEGFDPQTWKIKVFFWDADTQKPYGNFDEL